MTRQEKNRVSYTYKWKYVGSTFEQNGFILKLLFLETSSSMNNKSLLSYVNNFSLQNLKLNYNNQLDTKLLYNKVFIFKSLI